MTFTAPPSAPAPKRAPSAPRTTSIDDCRGIVDRVTPPPAAVLSGRPSSSTFTPSDDAPRTDAVASWPRPP
jgi:hypothetical protein